MRHLLPSAPMSTYAPMMTEAARSLASAKPELACPDCWRVWLVTQARDSIGYCRHGEVARWVRPNGVLVIAPGTHRKRHLAMVRALDRRRARGTAPDAGQRTRLSVEERIARRQAEFYRELDLPPPVAP